MFSLSASSVLQLVGMKPEFCTAFCTHCTNYSVIGYVRVACAYEEKVQAHTTGVPWVSNDMKALKPCLTLGSSSDEDFIRKTLNSTPLPQHKTL